MSPVTIECHDETDRCFHCATDEECEEALYGDRPRSWVMYWQVTAQCPFFTETPDDEYGARWDADAQAIKGAVT